MCRVYKVTEVAINKARDRGFGDGRRERQLLQRAQRLFHGNDREGGVRRHSCGKHAAACSAGRRHQADIRHQSAVHRFPVVEGAGHDHIGTASIMVGEVQLFATSARNCPKALRSTNTESNARPQCGIARRLGAVWWPKGYGLSFAVQALGLLAGAGLAQSKVKDYGFLLLVIDSNTYEVQAKPPLITRSRKP